MQIQYRKLEPELQNSEKNLNNICAVVSRFCFRYLFTLWVKCPENQLIFQPNSAEKPFPLLSTLQCTVKKSFKIYPK